MERNVADDVIKARSRETFNFKTSQHKLEVNFNTVKTTFFFFLFYFRSLTFCCVSFCCFFFVLQSLFFLFTFCLTEVRHGFGFFGQFYHFLLERCVRLGSLLITRRSSARIAIFIQIIALSLHRDKESEKKGFFCFSKENKTWAQHMSLMGQFGVCVRESLWPMSKHTTCCSRSHTAIRCNFRGEIDLINLNMNFRFPVDAISIDREKKSVSCFNNDESSFQQSIQLTL